MVPAIFFAHILRSSSNVTVIEFMGPTKILSFVVASLRIFDIRNLGQFKKMAPVHFEALDPIETVLYAWKLSSDTPK